MTKTVDLSIGSFLIGMAEGHWDYGDIVEGAEHLRYIVKPNNNKKAPLGIRLLWTYAHIEGDLRPYVHLVSDFNKGIADEIAPTAIINSIVKEYFVDNEGRPTLYNTSLSDDLLLTLFLQSTHVSMRGAFTYRNTSTIH